MKEHIHCKKCGNYIEGKQDGESSMDLEQRNPFYPFRVCQKCMINLALEAFYNEINTKEK
jgi:hypothetical protein